MDLGTSQYILGSDSLAKQCSQFVPPVLSGANVLEINSITIHNLSYPAIPPWNPKPVKNLSFCNISVALSHQDANDVVYVTVWLPLSGWNGRYQAVGGGGLAAEIGEFALVGALAADYATSSTDAGLTLNHTIDAQSGKWALNEDGSSNEELQLNFAWRSIHDMTVISKDLIKQFYGTHQKYSYWSGCSQGGRQGYAAAAKYPHDFDGIMANAPAIDSVQFVPSDFWPPVVMQNSEVPPFCVFEEYQKAIIAECDPLDGATDGLISDYDLLETCPFDPKTLIGTIISCREECVTVDAESLDRKHVPCFEIEDVEITPPHSEIVRKILQGPRTPDGTSLWAGVAPGASFFGVARTVKTNGDRRIPPPFSAAENWLKYLAMQDKDFDMTKMTYEEFYQAYDASVSRLTDKWGNHQLDLSDFSNSGGKFLTWFGLADQFISLIGILKYRNSVEEKLGGAEKVDEFYRLFLAPGAGHCAGGAGPNPIEPFKALVAWVEQGQAPEVLHAATIRTDGTELTRDLCRYPKKMVYKQGGDIDKASSFACM